MGSGEQAAQCFCGIWSESTPALGLGFGLGGWVCGLGSGPESGAGMKASEWVSRSEKQVGEMQVEREEPAPGSRRKI